MTLLPLPAGEGRGEGSRKDRFRRLEDARATAGTHRAVGLPHPSLLPEGEGAEAALCSWPEGDVEGVNLPQQSGRQRQLAALRVEGSAPGTLGKGAGDAGAGCVGTGEVGDPDDPALIGGDAQVHDLLVVVQRGPVPRPALTDTVTDCATLTLG